MRIQIDIEVLVILALIFMFVVWLIWNYLLKIWNIRRYKPENDKGRIGEEHRQELLNEGLPDPAKGIDGRIGTGKNKVKDTGRPRNSSKRSSIPTANINSVGEDSIGFGENVRNTRKFNPFRRWK